MSQAAHALRRDALHQNTKHEYEYEYSICTLHIGHRTKGHPIKIELHIGTFWLEIDSTLRTVLVLVH